MSNGFDRVCYARSRGGGFNYHVPLKIFTDSKTSWDTVTSLCVTAENRLLLDIYGLRDAYRTGELSDIARVATEFNPADALTKLHPSKFFDFVLARNVLRHPVAEHVEYAKLEMPRARCVRINLASI